MANYKELLNDIKELEETNKIQLGSFKFW